MSNEWAKKQNVLMFVEKESVNKLAGEKYGYAEVCDLIYKYVSESPSPLSGLQGEEIKPFDSAGEWKSVEKDGYPEVGMKNKLWVCFTNGGIAEAYYIEWEDGKNEFVDPHDGWKYVLDVIHYQIIIKPEPPVVLNSEQEVQASVARDSDSSTSDGKQNNSSNSGEQQQVKNQEVEPGQL